MRHTPANLQDGTACLPPQGWNRSRVLEALLDEAAWQGGALESVQITGLGCWQACRLQPNEIRQRLQPKTPEEK